MRRSELAHLLRRRACQQCHADSSPGDTSAVARSGGASVEIRWSTRALDSRPTRGVPTLVPRRLDDEASIGSILRPRAPPSVPRAPSPAPCPLDANESPSPAPHRLADEAPAPAPRNLLYNAALCFWLESYNVAVAMFASRSAEWAGLRTLCELDHALNASRIHRAEFAPP